MIPDLVRLAGASASLVPLGLAMGFSPTLYAYAVRELSTQTSAPFAERAVRWAAVGLVLGTLAQILLFRIVDPETLIRVLRLHVEHVLVTVWVDRVAGTVLLVAGVIALVRYLRRRDEPRRPASPEHAPADRLRPRHLIAIGAFGAVGVSDVATAYVAGRLIASSSRDLLLELLPLAVFLAVTAAPYLILAAAWYRLPRLARVVTRAFDALGRMDRRPLLVAALLIAGIVFLALGIRGAPDIEALPHRR